MWLFKTSEAKKNIFKKKLLEIAQLYVASTSINEFLVYLDLRPDLHISICKWTNPFIIHYMIKNNKILKFICSSLFPLFICNIGIIALLIPDKLIVINLFCVILQFSLLSIQIWLEYKDSIAQQYISQVEIGI